MSLMHDEQVRTAPQWTLGDRIRKARREANMTMEELAEAIGMRRESVARWERDETVPNVSRLRHIEDVCSVERGWLSTMWYTLRTWSTRHKRTPAATWRPVWPGTRVYVVEPS
jgi:transcriptional regulator with XRE-family HTH domain